MEKIFKCNSCGCIDITESAFQVKCNKCGVKSWKGATPVKRVLSNLRLTGNWWTIQLEFRLQDMLIGVRWENTKDVLGIYICILPTLSIHYWYIKKEKHNE